MALASLPAWAQDTATIPPKEWSFYASAFGYAIPDDQSYVSPVVTADRRKLHLEGRYNYEGLRTGSIWIGRNFSVGNKVTLDITPMIGGVFGRSSGAAPGVNATLSFGRFTFDTQSEYLFETDIEDRFFYTWSEFSYSPKDWFRVGLAMQRTKAYQTELDIQRGVFGGVAHKNWDFTAYFFNFGWTDVTSVFALGYTF